MRRTTLLACMALCLALSACNAMYAIHPKDLTGKPTVYAVVNKEPDPLLVGCYMRSRPEEYRRPNSYEYCLVKQGDQYAMYYYIKDGKSLAVFKNWSPCRIDGDSVTSGYDGSRYFVKDGKVWQMTTVGGPHRMLPMK
jgi:hypothetical protein